MKKTIVRLMAVCLSLIMAFAVMTVQAGCSIPDPDNGHGNEDIDPTKTQLFVHNVGTGYGSEWLYVLKDRFEKEYAEVSFDPTNPNIKGAQIIIEADSNGVQNSIGKSTDDLFFAAFNYIPDLVSQDVLLDITDWVTEPLTAHNETDSIESKLSSTQINYLKLNNKYYAVPHFFGTDGIIYDKDLFEEHNLYLARNGCPSESFIDGNEYEGEYIFTDSSVQLSAGPDGEYDTFDDGLPATYEEFYALCSQMVLENIVPFIWPGKYIDMHINYLLKSLKGEYEGYEQLLLNFTFNGTAKTLIDVSDDGTVSPLENTEIDHSTGYKLYQQAGSYYALKFIEEIINNNYYEENYCFDTTTHLQAQEHFIRSNYDSYYQKPIAMLLDGIWWQTEATEAFNRMSNSYPGTAKGDRNFGFMPMPKISQAQVGERRTVVEDQFSFAFVNKKIQNNPTKVNLCKTFLQYANTDISLNEFTRITGAPKALNYEIDSATKNSLTPFSKDVLKYINDKNTDVIHVYSSDTLFVSNSEKFALDNKFSVSPYGSVGFNIKKGITAETLFNNLKAVNNKDYWDLNYSSFYNK